MNDKEIVKSMVKFIEEKEKKLQADKMMNDNQAKNDIVKSILDELERELNEDKKN